MDELKTETEEETQTPEVLDEPTEETPEVTPEVSETPPEPPEQQFPAAVAGGLRRRARAAEHRAATAEGQLAALTQLQTVPAKSPLEIAAEVQGVTVNEVQMDGALYAAQRAFEAKQEAQVADHTAAQSRKVTNQESMRQAAIDFSEEKMGVGLDIETVCEMGIPYLSEGDRFDIAHAGAKSAQVAYKKCKQAILDSGTGDAARLQQRIKAHQSQPKPKTEGKPPEVKPKDETETKDVPTQDEILQETGTHHDPYVGQVFDL